MSPSYTSLTAVQNALQNGSTTATALVTHYLDRIAATKHLNAYVEVYQEEALAQAATLDAQLQTQQPKGRLWGMVISIKDVLCYKDHRVTAAAKILEGYISPFSATAIERLLAEGVIIIGRVNCDQFAMGSTNENSIYGPVRNAANPDRVPGGSSGGSAVAVQADTCLASLGTDTGGSVRQPAAFCGIIGMKPTYSRVSRHGLIAYGSSFDQIGTLTHSVADAALLLEIMAGADEYDSTVSQRPVPAYSDLVAPTRKMKIAYIPETIENEGVQADIRAATQQYMERLRADGHELTAVSFDYLDYIIPAYYVLTTAEASSNLSRFDGVRYGYRSPNATNLLETYQQSRSEGFSAEVKRRIMLGTFVLSAGYYDAYYTKAQRVRQLIRQRSLAILAEHDFILMPASPISPWPIGEKSNDPVAMYLADIYTVQANMAGLPAIALPIGHDQDGLPIGIQLMGAPFEEAALLAFAAQLT